MRRLAKSVVLIYVLVVAMMGFFQRKLLYHPRTAPVMQVAKFQDVVSHFPAAKDVQLTCDDGICIGGWLLRKEETSTADAQRPLVMYFHGNAGNRASRMGWYRIFSECGADVLAIDYHGYGDSQGQMSETGLEHSAKAAWKHATSALGYSPGKVTVAGTSLGGAAAVFAASEACQAGQQPAALFVVATFSSMVDVASSLYPWLPVKAVLADRYPSDDRIKSVTCPVVVLHGDEDRLVYQKFGRKLFDAAPGCSTCNTDKRWISLAGIGHNDILSSAGHVVRDEFSRLMMRPLTNANADPKESVR